MRNLFSPVWLGAAMVLGVSQAFGHGVGLTVNLDLDAKPASFTIASAGQVLDSANTPAPFTNLFWDKFAAAATIDGLGGSYYAANGGAAVTAGPWPAYLSSSFTILSPLYFAGADGLAAPASAGTYVEIVDRFPNNSDGLHAGAGSGDVKLYGNTGILSGFNTSLLDAHELQKRLYLGAGSTQTYGEYGFAFNQTVHFSDGSVVTSGPMVEIFALRDPGLPGGSFITASAATQDAATLALYAVAVPEPSTNWLAFSAVGCALVFWRHKRKGSVV